MCIDALYLKHLHFVLEVGLAAESSGLAVQKRGILATALTLTTAVTNLPLSIRSVHYGNLRLLGFSAELG